MGWGRPALLMPSAACRTHAPASMMGWNEAGVWDVVRDGTAFGFLQDGHNGSVCQFAYGPTRLNSIS